jgi:methylmalonyl-CoA mutase
MPLASEFPPGTLDAWRELVDAVLRGADFDKKLVTTTYDGLQIQPLYTPDSTTATNPAGFPGLAPFTRGSVASGHGTSGWDLRQAHPVGAAPALVNEAVLADLGGGANSVLLSFSSHVGIADLPAVLQGVLLDVAPVALEAGPWYSEAATALVAEWKRQQLPPSAWLGALRADPIGVLARYGALALPIDAALAGLAEIAASVHESPGVTVVAVDATPYADAGAGEAEELAVSLATGVAYLRALCDAGLSIDDALRTIEFTYTATADQFATICKLRAARRCWSRVAEASMAAPESGAQLQHVVTSAAMMSRRDPWVNLLRTTVACFAAGAGGAQTITVRPFDEALGLPDESGRRLARNISHLLVDEAHLDDVMDPAGGSHYVEAHTEDLAQSAWSRFTEIEASGGVVANLVSGDIQERVANTWANRLNALATRRDPLTGVSEFPDVHEIQLERAPHHTRADVRDPQIEVPPLPLRRFAGPYERLRDAAAAAPERPVVFLANLGPVAAHTARANFAKNFFEAGGIEAPGNDGFDSTAALVAAFESSGAKRAVLCSSDELYPDLVPDAAAALRGAGCDYIYLAGRPGDRAAADAAAGIDAHIHVGSDVIATLSEALAVSS